MTENKNNKSFKVITSIINLSHLSENHGPKQLKIQIANFGINNYKKLSLSISLKVNILVHI